MDESPSRSAQIEQQVEGQRSPIPAVIVILLTLGLLIFAGALFFREIPAANVRLVDTLFGGLIVGCTTAWGYYFTSNQSSEARAALRASKEQA